VQDLLSSKLNIKKQQIINLITLGLDFAKCCLIVGCTDEETELLKNDKEFQKELEIRVAFEESRLLKIHRETSIKLAKEKDIINGVQWKLKRLNPSKWGRKYNDNADLSGGGINIKLELVSKDDLLKDNSVEVHKKDG